MKGVGFHIILGLFILIPCIGAHAQKKEVLTPEAFIEQIRQFHPVAKQANLIRENAAAGLLVAKGGFDPVFEMNIDSKSLDGVSYYRYSSPGLKLPTPLGVGIKTGFENSSGQFRNPELTGGVASYIGIEVPLLNGLLIDKRRAALGQAKIYLRQSDQERQAIINDLLFNAYAAYWEWTSAYQLYRIYSNYVNVADRRNRLVSIAFRNGDRAVADTIEAFAQLQNYRLMQANALMELNTQSLELSIYLWSATGEPYLLPAYYQPDTTQFSIPAPLPDTSGLLNEVEMNHPVLRTTQFKLQGLEVERKLKFQNLLPTVNVQANILSKDYFNYKNLSAYYLENNYKFGLSMKVPLLFRQGRGDYKSIKIKIKDTNLELARKTWQLQTKIRQYYNEALQLREQLQTITAVYRNYSSLLKIEELRFLQGESSLFLVNARENKMLETEQKMIGLQAKYVKAVYAVRWTAGNIN
jgi:outer membrane protein TolC